MTKRRFTPWVVLACIGTLAACSSDGGGSVDNTEMNVVVPNGSGNGSTAPLALDIQVVEYTIQCDDGVDAGPFLDNDDTLDNDTTINGVLEVLDQAGAGVNTQQFGPDLSETYVWQGFMDLPPGDCTAQLRARDGDGEVICTATEPFTVTEDATVKVNVLMICDVSFQAPVGMLDLDASFSFVVGNFCPSAYVLNCIDSEIDVQNIPGVGDVAATACQVRYEDLDDTCGQGCDPQTCITDAQGLTCSPGPDPGVSTTVTCSGGASFLSCDGVNPSASCTFNGDVLGTIGGAPPLPLNPGPGGFFVGCALNPDGTPVTPGAVITCTSVTTDGDLDCDKTKVVTLTCEGLTPCQTFFAEGGSCDDSNECTVDSCDDTTGVAVCDNDSAAAEGNSCDPGVPGAGVCTDGTCVGQSCAAQPDPDGSCDDGNDCTVNTCDLQTGDCLSADVAAGTSCDGDTGQCDGAGTCDNNCSLPPFPGQCDDGNECTQNVCDPQGGATCSNPNEANGTSCDAGGGPGSGACNNGVCEAPPVIAAGSGQTVWIAETTPPGGGSTAVDGCSVFVTDLGTTIFIQVTITLDVTSDGANNVTTSWGVDAQQALLPVLGNAGELGGLSVAAAVTGASGGPIASNLTVAAQGELIGGFITGDTLSLNSPADITEGQALLTPTGGAGSTVNVNWDGAFLLDISVGGVPLITVDESICDFNVQGTGVDFGVN